MPVKSDASPLRQRFLEQRAADTDDTSDPQLQPDLHRHHSALRKPENLEKRAPERLVRFNALPCCR